MNYDAFLGEVQNRAQLPSREGALQVSRITLETLSRRIQPGDAENLAAQLPEEIGRHLEKVDAVETFAWTEFVARVVESGGYDPDTEEGDAVHHARVVMDVVDDAVTAGALADVRKGLPAGEDWDELFLFVDQDDPPVPEEQRPE